MLTGDKLETATCIAKSSHLVSRTQDIHIFRPVSMFLSHFEFLNALLTIKIYWFVKMYILYVSYSVCKYMLKHMLKCDQKSLFDKF